ncbi:amidohydrolase family protein [Paenibacillus hemerocallicola]|nr:amidohydrolase family protein [Paenibacillus hemerocallicola]
MSRGMTSYLLQVGRLIDGTGRAEIADASILIEQGRIRYAGPRREAPPAGDAVVMDAEEMTALPGLIDGHNGLTGEMSSVSALKGYLEHGVTTVATFLGNAAGRAPAIPLREAIRRGELPGCASLVVGYIVNGSNAFQRGETADGPWEIRRAVHRAAEAGADFIKAAATGSFTDVRHRTYTREELEALADEAHSWGLPVVIHAHTQPGLDRSIEAGADLIVHGCFADPAAIDRMARRGATYMPTLRVTSARNVSGFSDEPSVYASMSEAQPAHRAAVRRAIRNGVGIALGSHGPGLKSVWPHSGETTAFELAELVRCGLSPLQAISAGTLQTARAFRLDGRLGSLSPGKQADVLCIRGNPLQRIELLREQERVALVFRHGRLEYVGGTFRGRLQ